VRAELLKLNSLTSLSRIPEDRPTQFATGRVKVALDACPALQHVL